MRSFVANANIGEWLTRCALYCTPYIRPRCVIVRAQLVAHLACPRCAWRRCKTCACPGMSCVLLAPHTDGGAILRHFKRDTTLALAGGKPALSRLRTHCETHAGLDPVLCKLSCSIEKDTFLVPRFHAQWVMQNLRGANATMQLVPNAGHYAFITTPTMDLPSPDGSVGRDPQGFDRAAFLNRLAQESVAFFNKNLR